MSLTPSGSRGEGRQPRLPPAYRLVALDSVVSTNDEARRLIAEGAEDGTLVWARQQSRGRGRRGREWASPRGNLYLSLVLRPNCDLAAAAQVGFLAAAALCEALGTVMPPLSEVTVKWPNDVLVNDRKVAGILLEAVADDNGDLDALILGMGVNIVHCPAETQFPATSLRDEGAGREVEAAVLLEAFARHFLSWLDRWLDDGFPPVRRAWLNRARGRGAPIEARLPGETLRGIFRDLDETGAMVLEMPDGTMKRVTAGDVFWTQTLPRGR